MGNNSSTRIVHYCVMLVLIGLASCGGNNNQIAPAPEISNDIPAMVGFKAVGSGSTSHAELDLIVNRQDGQVVVQVVAGEKQQLDSLFFDLAYDASAFTPVSAQASGVIAQLSDSLCLEILNEPGLVTCGQVPLTGMGAHVQAGAVLAEVLFIENPFTKSAASAETQVPQNNHSLSPLVWDHEVGEFRWYMVNTGDYDQNGIVAISDLSPLATHIGMAGPFSFFDSPSVIDGISDGDINVSDITSIVLNYNNYIEGFNLYSSENLEDVPIAFNETSVTTPIASFTIADALGDASENRLWFSYTPEDGQDGVYFWVRPYSGETEGTRSNLMSPTMDSSPPIGNPGGGFNLAPVAMLSLNATGTSVPLDVVFDASLSTDPDGEISLYEWDFEGDGLFDSFSTEPVVQHTFLNIGTYAPLVRVSDNGGLWDTVQSPPFVVEEGSISNIAPIADVFATASSGVLPFTIGLIATGSMDMDGYIAKYEWDFDSDGEYELDSGTDPTVLHTYEMSGTYLPKVKVTDNQGGIATATVQVVAIADNQAPIASLTADNTTGNAPFQVNFHAGASYDFDGTIVEYAWDWDGDGMFDGTSNSAIANHTYMTEGTYTALVRVEDDGGLWGTDTLEITVDTFIGTPPVADLQADVVTGLTPLTVVFDASASYAPNGTIVEYAWDWNGNGIYDGITYDPIATYTFTSAGSPEVRVRVKDNEGLGAIAKILIEINVAGNAVPTAQLDVSPQKGINPLLVTLDASGSIDPDGVITTYEWDFDGDGNYDLVDVNNIETFTYTDEGVFEPRVRVTDNVGAQDSVSGGAVQTHVEDWPMFGHDLQHTRQSWFQGPVTNSAKWIFTTGDGIWSSPSIGDDGTIYIGCNDDKLYAMNPDGTLKWTYNTAFPVISPPAVGKDGTIYFGSWSNKLYAIDPDGNAIWNFPTGDNISGSPTIGTDGTIYIGSSDSLLYAVNPDGSEKWTFATDGAVRSSAAISPGGTIYVGNDAGNLYAINPDGTQEWVYPIGSGVFSSPSIAADGTIYVGGGQLMALNPDGTLYWTYSTGGLVTGSPAIGFDGTIYIGSYSNDLHAVNPNGISKWRYTTGNIIRSSPAIGLDGTIYIGSHDNNMHAINPDGSGLWTRSTGGDIYSAPCISLDGTLYFGSMDRKIYAMGGS